MSRAFTFIEILITLAIIAVCFLPLMLMFSTSVDNAYLTTELTTARYLAQEGMERVKNLGLTITQLSGLLAANPWYPALDEDPIDMTERKWRIKREVAGADPLEIKISVYRVPANQGLPPYPEPTGDPLVDVMTSVTDLDSWVPQ